MLIISAPIPYLSAEKEKGRLRRFEDGIDAEPKANEEEDKEEQKRKQEDLKAHRDEKLDIERWSWRREHPGEPLPKWLEPVKEEESASGSNRAVDSLSLVALVVFAPFLIPRAVLGDEGGSRYAKYPFSEVSADGGRKWASEGSFSGQLAQQGIWGFRGDLGGTHKSRFGLDAAYTEYQERIKTRREFLYFAEILPSYRFAESPSWKFTFCAGYQRIQGLDTHHFVKLAYKISFFHEPVEAGMDLAGSFSGGFPVYEVFPCIAVYHKFLGMKAGYRRYTVLDEYVQGPELSFAIKF